MFNLTGKTALVTGASGGIGSAIAKALATQGATVCLSGTREAVLEEVRASLPGEGHQIATCNLSDPESVEALIPAALEKLVKDGAHHMMTLPGATPIEGGEPVMIEGQCVGAVGVSGVQSFQDGVVARAGVAALSSG